MITFHDLYQQYARDVYRFALFLTGDPAEADDLTSEAFVRAWTASGGIRQSTVKAYLFTIARNLHRDGVRLGQRRADLNESIPEPKEGARQMENRVEVRRVMQGIRDLPPLDRTVLLLRIYDEMSYDEIGETVGLDAAAVRMRVHRARVKLARGR